jgi:hypothetical protein
MRATIPGLANDASPRSSPPGHSSRHAPSGSSGSCVASQMVHDGATGMELATDEARARQPARPRVG